MILSRLLLIFGGTFSLLVLVSYAKQTHEKYSNYSENADDGNDQSRINTGDDEDERESKEDSGEADGTSTKRLDEDEDEVEDHLVNSDKKSLSSQNNKNEDDDDDDDDDDEHDIIDKNYHNDHNDGEISQSKQLSRRRQHVPYHRRISKHRNQLHAKASQKNLVSPRVKSSINNLKETENQIKRSQTKRKHRKKKHKKRIKYSYEMHMKNVRNEMKHLADIAIASLKFRKVYEKERKRKMKEWDKKLKDMKSEKKEYIPEDSETDDDKSAIGIKKRKTTAVTKPLCADICQHRCLQSCHIACCVPDLTPTMRNEIVRRMEIAEEKENKVTKKCPRRCLKSCDTSCDFLCCLPEDERKKYKKVTTKMIT